MLISKREVNTDNIFKLQQLMQTENLQLILNESALTNYTKTVDL